MASLIDEAEDVETAGDGEFARNDVIFAAKTSSQAIELRLGQEIAEAARRTPATHPSARGHEWVVFSPQEWDEHAADRLEAWFRVAWRLAGDR